MTRIPSYFYNFLFFIAPICIDNDIIQLIGCKNLCCLQFFFLLNGFVVAYLQKFPWKTKETLCLVGFQCIPNHNKIESFLSSTIRLRIECHEWGSLENVVLVTKGKVIRGKQRHWFVPTECSIMLYNRHIATIKRNWAWQMHFVFPCSAIGTREGGGIWLWMSSPHFIHTYTLRLIWSSFSPYSSSFCCNVWFIWTNEDSANYLIEAINFFGFFMYTQAISSRTFRTVLDFN